MFNKNVLYFGADNARSVFCCVYNRLNDGKNKFTLCQPKTVEYLSFKYKTEKVGVCRSEENDVRKMTIYRKSMEKR